ncbi:hypothetical protein QUS89_22760, partial [Xanthomonas citri pv. citri]
MGSLSAYETEALAACLAYREQAVRRAPSQVTPGLARRVAGRAQQRVRDIPGAERVGQLAASGAARATGG